MENKVIPSKEFNVKESQRYKVLVLINRHQDLEMIISSIIRSPMEVPVV